MSGSYVMTGSSAQLEIEMGGILAGAEYDELVSTGTVALAGTLDMDVVNAGGGFYLPDVGDVITIITATGGISGTFANSASLWAIAGGFRVDWSITYNTNSVMMEVTSVVSLGVDGDYNGNGVVDAADYSVWRDTLGGIDLAADGNHDGLVNQLDYDFWVAHFGETVGSGAGAVLPPGDSPGANYAVPEPASLLLVAIGMAWAVLGCTGRRA
jgi:hypothetical protein